jgi:tRNA(fMet)-specific endonuclease VapC
MVCLDTSVVVAMLRKDRAATERLRSEVEGGGTLSTTMVILCELYSGAFGANDPQKELNKIEELLANLEILGLEEGAARRYGELVNDATLKRAPIGDFDLIIASIALEQGERLVTRNVRHFSRIPGLVTEQW